MGWRRRLLALGAVVGLLATAAGGAYLGVHLPDWRGGALEDARTAHEQAETELARTAAELDAVREERDALRARIDLLTERLAENEREVGSLQSALAVSGPFSEQYTAVTSELASLKSAYASLQEQHRALEEEMSTLVRIRTPELKGDALLLDRSVAGVTYTGAVCSGSMEPTITCDDLLILYPASITDLNVGDVIYFRRPAADCSGPMDGRYMVHRIVRVTAGSEGIAFQTKGDAFSAPDPCPVPAGDVLYKLLTTVREGRIDG